MSQDDRLSESPPSTYPFDTDPSNFDYHSSQNDQDSCSSIWGRLMPMSTNLKCCVIDLEHDTYLFGRQASCEFVFCKSNISEENIRFVSKKHFSISHHNKTAVSIVFIEDLSSNGTFVNGIKVGRGKKVPLNNNDVISLALPHFQVFVYMDLRAEDNTKYPPEIKRRYTITREIGRGSCGRVKLVFEKNTCRMLAMKIIQKSKNSYGGISDPKKIESEVKILKSLNHPCVITMEDFVDTPDEFFIILTLAEGGDLMNYIRKNRRLSEKETRKIFYQIVLAVEYLHNCGIAHRDLKPQNILLTGQGEEYVIKVSDFGLSKPSGNGLLLSESWANFGDGNSLMQTVCGSPLYVAPEVLEAALSSSEFSGYTKKVDIWSMGVIMYICLSGHNPFLHSSEGDVGCQDEESIIRRKCSVQTAILNGMYSFPVDSWKGVSEEAKDLIRKMLNVNPEKRITIKQIIDHPWLQDFNVKEKVDRLIRSQSSNNSGKLSNDSEGDISDYIPALKRQKLNEDNS